MPTADELLSSLSDSIPEHTHRVVDSDTYFIIDPITRLIANTTNSKNVLMQYDHDSERFTFELPRYVEGHDMMLCNRVKVHFINISEGYGETPDVYDVDDLRINPDDASTVICTWLISRNATLYPGVLSFLVQYCCVDGDGNMLYEWHTDIFSDIEVKPGRNNGEAAILEYSDILEQWRARLFNSTDSLIAEIEAASATQQANIEAKGAETLATIPEDYTETHNMADEALRRKADAIIMSESGEAIVLDDSSDCNMIGLNLYGRTDQIKTTGKNLVSIEENFSITGSVSKSVNIPAGTYIVNCKTLTKGGAATPVVRFTTNDVIKNITTGGLEVVLTVDETSLLFYSNGYDYPGSQEITSTITQFMIRSSAEEDPTYEPYTGGVSSPSPEYPQELESVVEPTTYVYGKNLLNLDAMLSNKFVESDGVYTLSKNGTDRFTNFAPIYIPSNTKFTFSLTIVDSTKERATLPLYVTGESGENYYLSTSSSIDACYDEPIVSVRFYLQSSEADGAYISMRDIQLEISDTATEYDPYKSSQSLAIIRTLRGIPVSQNGNYTDANGQQWICDEIDFERSKFIQRVGEVTYDGTESWLKSGTYNYYLRAPSSLNIQPICNKLDVKTSSESPYISSGMTGDGMVAHVVSFGPLENNTAEGFKSYMMSNPLVVQYALATPIETDLTAAEMEAFRALHTNATNTVINSNRNTHMQVKYVADLERYIHKNVSYKKQQLTITLTEANWVESSDGRYYTQVLSINARPNSEINLNPTAAQQVSLILDGIAMFVANENGVVTAYAIGGTPGRDVTYPATETVVVYT